MADDIKHYGVMGMKWGQGRAAGNITSVKVGRGPVGRLKELAGLGVDAVRDDVNKLTGHMRESIAQKYARQNNPVTKKIIDDANAVLNNPKATKVELDKALASIGIDPVKGKIVKTKPVYDENGNDVSVNPVKRLLKEKGQSDKDFDKEIETEMSSYQKPMVGKVVKTLFGNRTEPVFDANGKDISSKPFWRPFKKKGQTDKEYDSEIDSENSNKPNDIAKRKVEEINMNRQAKVEMAVALTVAGGMTIAMIAANRSLKNAAFQSAVSKYGVEFAKRIYGM